MLSCPSIADLTYAHIVQRENILKRHCSKSTSGLTIHPEHRRHQLQRNNLCAVTHVGIVSQKQVERISALRLARL